jgi:hypothetical protein
MKTKSKPVHEIRLGAVKAAVWANNTEAGVRHNVTFSRSYRDGDVWKSADSFGRDDLLLLAKVSDEAHTWIHRHSDIERESNESRQSEKKVSGDRV